MREEEEILSFLVRVEKERRRRDCGMIVALLLSLFKRQCYFLMMMQRAILKKRPHDIFIFFAERLRILDVAAAHQAVATSRSGRSTRWCWLYWRASLWTSATCAN